MDRGLAWTTMGVSPLIPTWTHKINPNSALIKFIPYNFEEPFFRGGGGLCNNFFGLPPPPSPHHHHKKKIQTRNCRLEKKIAANCLKQQIIKKIKKPKILFVLKKIL